MRVRLTYVLGVSGFISLACAVVVCVLIANFIDDRVNTERAMSFGAAETVVQSGVNALRIDLRRMQLYSGQIVARLLASGFHDVADAQVALNRYNQSLFTEWGARLQEPGEVYGFGVSMLFPTSATPRPGESEASRYAFQIIQTYNDPLKNGGFQHVHTYTDVQKAINTFSEVYLDNITGFHEKQYLYDLPLSIEYVLLLYYTGTDFYDSPLPWAASDGNPFWYYNHARVITNTQGAIAVCQTFQSSSQWSDVLRAALRPGVAEHLYLLTENGYVVTSTDVRIQQAITNCAVNETTSTLAATACVNMKFSAFPGLRHVAGQVETWISQKQFIADTEMEDDSGINKIVTFSPAFESGALVLRIVYVGDRPEPDRKTLIVFANMMAFTLLTVVLTFLGVVALLQPLKRAARDMRLLAELEFSAFRDDKDSVVAESNDVLESTNALIVAMESFTRYMSVGLVKHLMHSNEIAAVGTRTMDIVILFTDIVGFTDMCSRLSVNEMMTSFLGRFFDVCSEAVMSTGGTVDKFIGDCVMAFWGAPVPHAHASTAAVCAALHMFHALMHPEHVPATDHDNNVVSNSATKPTKSRHRRAGLRTLDALGDSSSAVSSHHDHISQRSSAVSYFETQVQCQHIIRTRTGINRGEAHVGNVGCEQRLSYTALGDCVNVASRMEALNKQVSEKGCGIVASEAVMEGVHGAVVRRFVGPTMLIGKQTPIDVYSIIGIDDYFLTTAQPTDNAPELSCLRRLRIIAPSVFISDDETELAKAYSAKVQALVAAHGTGSETMALSEAIAASNNHPDPAVLHIIAAAGVITQASK
jgi:class 3 adenylate cyclase